MATEKYGIKGELIQSLAATPVSTDTTLIFIGACASGTLNTAHVITSMAEYQTKLGGAPGDGYNLTDAAIAAFQIAGIAQIIMIPVSHDLAFNSADYIGSADALTGVYAIEELLRRTPTTVNVICAPRVSEATVLAAIKSIAMLADGHWQSVFVYDLPQASDQLNAAGIAQVAEIVEDKTVASEYGIASWGYVKTDGGYIVSGAAVRCCLMARSDANYGVPARSGGNLNVPGMSNVGIVYGAAAASGSGDVVQGTVYVFAQNAGSAGNKISVELIKAGATSSDVVVTIKNDGTSVFSDTISGLISDSTGIERLNTISGIAEWVYFSGSYIGNISSTSAVVITLSGGADDSFHAAILRESDATQLSADGICSWVNYSGTFYTWGDHTSAFAAGTISDERGRFDNTMRMLLMILNRYQLKYRTSIDNPMTLQMRNDVINEELDYLTSLVAIGALIGDPVCEFSRLDNSQDTVAQGQFTWRIAATPTIPFKFGDMKVAYSQAGLSVYLAE